jgi:hypothetical protein
MSFAACAIDQLIHFMQQHTLDDAAPVVCTVGEPPCTIVRPLPKLRSDSKIRYVVTTRGVPTRVTVADSTLRFPNAPTSVDNHLK